MDDANARKLQPPLEAGEDSCSDKAHGATTLELVDTPHVIPPLPGQHPDPMPKIESDAEAEAGDDKTRGQSGGFIPDMPNTGSKPGKGALKKRESEKINEGGDVPQRSRGAYLPTWERGAKAGNADKKALMQEYNRLRGDLGSGRLSPNAVRVIQQRRAILLAQLQAKKHANRRFILLVTTIVFGIVGALFYLSEFQPGTFRKYTKPILRKIEKIQTRMTGER